MEMPACARSTSYRLERRPGMELRIGPKAGAASCIVVYHNCATSAASLRNLNSLRGLTSLRDFGRR
jgi:hypothetical protein